jgi:hypothetical protein
MTSYGSLRLAEAAYGVRYGSPYREGRPYVQPLRYGVRCTVGVRCLYGWRLPYTSNTSPHCRKKYGKLLARLIVCSRSPVSLRPRRLPSRGPNNRTGATTAYLIDVARLCEAFRRIATAFATARAAAGCQPHADAAGVRGPGVADTPLFVCGWVWPSQIAAAASGRCPTAQTALLLRYGAIGLGESLMRFSARALSECGERERAWAGF